MADKLKLVAALLMVAAGIAGFYYLGDEAAAVLKLLSVLVGVLLGAAIAWTSEPGKRFFVFWKESVAEAKKVVWPTRKEAVQTTGMVIAFTVVMAVFLWMVDAGLMWVVDNLMGRVD